MQTFDTNLHSAYYSKNYLIKTNATIIKLTDTDNY